MVSVSAVVLAFCVEAATSSSVFGVAPSDQARYTGGTFACLDGHGAGVVNDEFCECADGSDEPGTGACAGEDTTLFYCQNEGSTPRRLYASRVGDGICDCCDGTDEHYLAKRRGGSSKCENVCVEQGIREREEAAQQAKALQSALEEQKSIKAAAMKEREEELEQIKSLAAELPFLEEALKAAKAEADKEREAEKKNRDEAAAAADASPCRWRQTGGCKPTGDREPNNDKPCSVAVAKGESGYCDCNGDGFLGDKEPGYTCDVAVPGTCLKACAEAGIEVPGSSETVASGTESAGVAGAEVTGEETAAKEQGEKKVVSEYAKWMDGAAETLGGEEDDEAMDEDVAAIGNSQTLDSSAAGVADGAKQTAVDRERDASRKVDDNKRRTHVLQAKIDALPEDKLGYASLAGKTISKRVGEFEYKLEFFSDAKQDYTSLGKWSMWTGPKSAIFEGGTHCWDGPARQLKVQFHCGPVAKILDVAEPSRCVYEGNFVHPGACDAKDLELLTSGDRVIGPHEEL